MALSLSPTSICSPSYPWTPLSAQTHDVNISHKLAKINGCCKDTPESILPPSRNAKPTHTAWHREACHALCSGTNVRLGAPRVAVDSVRAQDGKQKPKALQQHTGAKLPPLSCSPSLHTVWWRELTPGKLSLLFIFGKPEPDNQG